MNLQFTYSIIIPAYDNHEMTADCLESVAECTIGGYEVILVDNGSNPRYQQNGDVRLKVIRNGSNFGFPVAINQGIEEANGEIIILLNNDCIVTPGWNVNMDRIIDYDILGPATNYCAGIQQQTINMYNNKEELYSRAIEHHECAKSLPVLDVNWIIGFCMMFRKSLWEELGPFDESLWPCSGEELDFCLRAKSAGYRIGVVQDTYIHHYGSQTFRKMGVDYNDICIRNETHVAKKWGSDFWNNQLVI